MTKRIFLSSAILSLLSACGDGESKPTPDAARPIDTAPAMDTVNRLDVPATRDAPASDGKTVDGATLDVPVVDAPAMDAPATDAGSDGSALGDAHDALPCFPSLPIVRIAQSINTATTWTTGKVYVIEQSIVVNAVLTIEPDVIVKFQKGPMITLGTNGVIIADGKSESGGILFTSIKDDNGGDTNGDCDATKPAPGDWASIKISHSGSVFNYASFNYAGSAKPYSGALSVINGGTAQITNCQFWYNDGGELDDTRAAALNLGGAAAGTVANNNLFANNIIPLVTNGLLNIDATNRFYYTGLVSHVTYTNKYNGIFMDGVQHRVTGAITWSNTTVPYVLYQVTMTVADGGTLTLADNVVVKNFENRIDVANLGTLTAGNNVSFTSFNDDTKLGDTNGDGPASTPVTGDWVGVNLCKPLCAAATWAGITYASKN